MPKGRLTHPGGLRGAFLLLLGLTTACGQIAALRTAATPEAITLVQPTIRAEPTELAAYTSTPPATAIPVPTAAVQATADAMPTLEPTATPEPSLAAAATSEYVVASQRPHSTRLQIVDSGNVAQTVAVDYLLYLPRGYGQDPQRRWPLILFLHGSEERGDDPRLLTRNGLPKILEEQSALPCVVVSPQCPLGSWWWPRTKILAALLDWIQTTYLVDANRLYLTGISMGAYGAWALALRYPRRFAALVPIAGGADFQSGSLPANMCDLKRIPVWAFHGERDANVSPLESKRAVNALQACGGNVRLTLYPEADHEGAWELAYSDPVLYSWLLQQALPMQ